MPVATGFRLPALPLASSALALLILAPVPSALAQGQAAARSGSDSGLEEIVVTAAGFRQAVINAPASITVLPRIELEQQRASSLAEVLANVQGIDVGDSVGKVGGMDISIRGMPSDYSLLLVDGRRQNPAGNVTPNGFGDSGTGFIPPVSAIERIEVVRGPMSTLYGSDAMGGVINIITRSVGEAWHGSVGLDTTIQEDTEFGNTSSGNFYLHGPLVKDTLGLALRGRIFNRSASNLSFLDENGEEIKVSKRGPSPVKADVRTIGGRLTLTPHEDHDIWFDADITEQRYDNSQGQLGTLGIQGYGPEQQFNREQFLLAHTWRVANGQLDTDITRNTTETLGRILPSDVPGTDRVAGDPRTLEAENTIFNSRFYSQIDAFTFTVGGQYWDAKMVDGVAPEPFEHTQWALFAENEWRMRENLRLTLGIRYDDHNIFGGNISPRGYLVWNATEEFTLKGGVSQGFKTPRLEQIAEGITGFVGQGTIPVIGTPDLKPETSTNYEFGVYYDRKNGITANATVFYNQFDDKIASGLPVANCSFGLTPEEYGVVPGPAGCADYGYWPNTAEFGQSINIDKAETRGLEAGVAFDLSDSWRISGNYTYTDSKQKSGEAEGEPLVNTPKHMINSRLSWDMTDRLNAWLRGEYRTKRYRGAGDAQDQLGSFKSYALFHLGGAFAVNETVSINATIYNLLDKDFVEYAPYMTRGAEAYTNLYAINQEPRRLWVSMNAEF